MKNQRKYKSFIFLAVLMFVVSVCLGTASAMEFELGPDTTIDVDVLINYGAAVRVEDQDDDLLEFDINEDDGNRNFDQWSMTTNKISTVIDIDFQHKDFGLFARPKAFYDHVYMTDNDNDSPTTNNALLCGLIGDTDEWADDVEDIHGRNWEILDLFAYGTFDIGNSILDLRVGKQMIFWGEGFLITGIAGVINPVDLPAAAAVGTEVKEILLPTESVYVQFAATEDLNISAYYQWKWHPYRLFEGGTYFATNDWLDDLDAMVLVAPSTPAFSTHDTLDAKDECQYGVALHYVARGLENTEFGLYYINYHSKLPSGAVLDLANGRLLMYFAEDIDIYAASFSTQIGDWNIAGEFAYYRDFAYDFGDRDNRWQAQINGWYFYPGIFNSRGLLIAEVGCGRDIGRPDSVFAWGYVLANTFSWGNVWPSVDMDLALNFSDNPSGTNQSFSEGGSTAGSIGVTFTYDANYIMEIVYENEFNSSPMRNKTGDRDTVSLTLGYSF